MPVAYEVKVFRISQDNFEVDLKAQLDLFGVNDWVLVQFSLLPSSSDTYQVMAVFKK